MPNVSKETADQVNDQGPAQARRSQIDGYTINFVTIREDADLAPLLKGLPDDQCQCPHRGYILKGKMTWRFGDREEVNAAGDAFYAPPGHTPAAEAGTEFVQFSLRDELVKSEEQIRKNMQAMRGG